MTDKHLLNQYRRGDALTECGKMAARSDELTTELDERTCGPCRNALIFRGVCPACGEQQLSWGTHPRKKTNVADGRLTAHDVETIFYLACDYCSETVIPQVGPDQVAAWLNASNMITLTQAVMSE